MSRTWALWSLSLLDHYYWALSQSHLPHCALAMQGQLLGPLDLLPLPGSWVLQEVHGRCMEASPNACCLAAGWVGHITQMEVM